jgi:hypothetical protein
MKKQVSIFADLLFAWLGWLAGFEDTSRLGLALTGFIGALFFINLGF